MNGYYIVTPDGQRWPLMALSVDHQFDQMEYTFLDSDRRHFAPTMSRTVITAEVVGGMESEPRKCEACGSSNYQWSAEKGHVCSYCRTPA